MEENKFMFEVEADGKVHLQKQHWGWEVSMSANVANFTGLHCESVSLKC